MKFLNLKFALFLIGIFFISCERNEISDKQLYDQFQTPSAEARPMVRWWWNGNAVEADEIRRELEVMKNAGIGGVEINSIAMPPGSQKTNAKALQWAGKEWISMVKVASEKATELGMITDLIVGSGWPFGGRFLTDDEIMQRLGVKKQFVEAGSTVNINLEEVLSFKSHYTPGAEIEKPTSDVALLSAKLIPVNVNSIDEIIDITSVVKNNRLVYQVKDDFYLVLVYNERNFKHVYHGSPGADGPIMDHYKTEVVRGYLNRLKAIEEETGMSLDQLIRALFCDSIELGGSNWTDDMKEQFKVQNGYDISPWLPFVIQPAGSPNQFETSKGFAETIRRVQYDYYNTIINVFLERFTKEFQKFCTENNVLCRYQAYGTPFYMGLFQGNMIPDIPESNNWIYSGGKDEAEISEYTWNLHHGYMLWNKAASSGAHITGRKIVSCEAMTNTGGVFRTSLETIKQSDDMNFITGMNHAVLHGYNYSPPEAGFPGWVRYGAYFSEHNTWWKHIKRWTDYNARLSSVFQNSKPEIDIAILGRVRDYWGEVGPERPYLNASPWYYARLWEPISNHGSSCDYIHQPLVETAGVQGNKLLCGEMEYKAIILTEVASMSPAAAQKLSDFAEAGGKVVFIGTRPYRSLSLNDAEKNDALVNANIERILKSKNGILLEAPEEGNDFLEWTKDLMQQIELQPQVKISHPQSHLYSMKQSNGEQDIFFFVNSNRKKPIEFDAGFNAENKVPCIWMPESGERYLLKYKAKNQLSIKLNPLESALIVFESNKIDLPVYEFSDIPGETLDLNPTWEVKFEHINSSEFTRQMKELVDFSLSDDKALQNFSGTVSYSTQIEGSKGINYIILEEVNQAVSTLLVNGERVDTKWYGRHIYELGDYLKPGSNTIDIGLTTTLANYCRSLTDNPTAQRWTRNYKKPFSSGLEGVVFTR